MLVGFRNMSTFNKLKNLHAVRTRSYIFAIWHAQGFIESILYHFISVDVWLHLLKTNTTVHFTPDFFLDDKVLQAVISKNPILKIVVDLNRNDVGLY